jgi:hypothetical protein
MARDERLINANAKMLNKRLRHLAAMASAAQRAGLPLDAPAPKAIKALRHHHPAEYAKVSRRTLERDWAELRWAIDVIGRLDRGEITYDDLAVEPDQPEH